MRGRLVLYMVALLVLVSGCGHSPPTHFVTLDAVKPSRPPVPVAGSPMAVIVGRLPAELDRLSLVREPARGQITITQQDRWAAPLGDLIRQALLHDLEMRLPHGLVGDADKSRVQGVRALVVDILNFEPDPQHMVTLEANWRLTPPGSSEPTMRHHVRLNDRRALPDAVSQARAMSDLLGKLSDDIVRKLAVSSGPRQMGRDNDMPHAQ